MVKGTVYVTVCASLERTSIFCRDALNVIETTDTPTTFHYVDPPYFNADMGHYSGYTEADFIHLLDILAGIEGKFLLSSYPSEVLSDYALRNKWHTINIDMTRSSGGGKKTEVLTLNYSRNFARQLKLF